MEKKYCKDCKFWYHSTKADQCEIPSNGLQWKIRSCGENQAGFEKALSYMRARGLKETDCDPKAVEFLLKCMNLVNFFHEDRRKFFGHPSQLNKENNCIFYKPTLRARIKKLFFK